MIHFSGGEAAELSAVLRFHRESTAAAVTEKFLKRHPDWLARYGERARALGIEDATFHINFLAGAVEAGREEAYAGYTRWVVRVLAARGIAASFLAENLQEIWETLEPRLSDEQKVVVRSLVAAGCAAAAEGPEVVFAIGADTQLSDARSAYVVAVLNGDRRAAANIVLDAIRASRSVGDVYVEIFQEAQYEIGRMWERNVISVAQEHMATATTQFVMGQAYSHLPVVEPHRGRMVLTGVEGEFHQVGANMVADVLESEGWDVKFLGTNMPHKGIYDALEQHQVGVLGISATMLFNLPKVRDLIAGVRDRFGPSVRIVLGGKAFPAKFDPGEIGADDLAGDLRSTLRLLCGHE